MFSLSRIPVNKYVNININSYCHISNIKKRKKKWFHSGSRKSAHTVRSHRLRRLLRTFQLTRTNTLNIAYILYLSIYTHTHEYTRKHTHKHTRTYIQNILWLWCVVKEGHKQQQAKLNCTFHLYNPHRQCVCLLS